MKHLTMIIFSVLCLNAFATEEVTFCYTRNYIVDLSGQGEGVAIMAKSEHYSKDYFSDLICRGDDSSYLQFKASYGDRSEEIRINDELCSKTLKRMRNLLEIGTGLKAYKFVIENNEVVDVIKTNKKCKQL